LLASLPSLSLVWCDVGQELTEQDSDQSNCIFQNKQLSFSQAHTRCTSSFHVPHEVVSH
jgi:hypothetical protein